MQTWMKVILGGVVAVFVLIGLVFWITGDIAKAGDEFFAAAKNDDMDTAYNMLSPDFQAGVSKADLKDFLAANALDKVTEVSWGSRSISNNTGELQGTLTTESGGVIPVTLGLVNSDGGWKIQSLQKANAGITTGSSRPKFGD